MNVMINILFYFSDANIYFQVKKSTDLENPHSTTIHDDANNKVEGSSLNFRQIKEGV